jgi:hypothetical protein
MHSISHPYHSARAVHTRRHYPDVQDFSIELPDHGLQPQCAIPGWNQVWGLSGYGHRNVDVRLLFMHFPSEGQYRLLGHSHVS